MIVKELILGMAVLWFLAAGGMPGLAAEPQPGAAATQAVVTTGTPATGAVVYVPPKVGAPRGRVGGGARGGAQGPSGESPVSLSALAPDHPGLTVEAQPTLYWYLSRSSNAPVEFTIMTDETTRPLFETQVTDSGQPGVQRVRLADYEVRLEPGVAYRWYVALVPEPARRSRDILAGGVIERVAPPPDLDAKLSKAQAADAPRIFAEAGLWYNAIASLSALIEASPRDAALKEQRAVLLEQVGLKDAAAYDRTETAGK